MVRNTKQKLIETAVELIWQSSYGSVSVDDICKAADVKKGSFYHFFPSKVDLAVAAMDRHFQEKKEVMDKVFSPSVPPLQRFDMFVDVVMEVQEQAFEKYGKVCGCPFASMGCEMAGQEELIRAKIEDIFKTHTRYIENALRDAVAEGTLDKDVDVPVLSAEIGTYLLGQMMMARISNSLDGMRRDLKEGVFRIIGASYDKEKAA